MVMLFAVAPGYTIRFLGLELVNHFDVVGPSFRTMRLSPGANVLFERCVQRRVAGLPLAAAVVNMVSADRPVGNTGQQTCFIVDNFTFASTRSPGRPLTYPQAVNMADYATTNPPDRSLASQGLYYGGYSYYTHLSYYIVDNVVSQACLEKHPGSECVTLLLQQLAASSAPPPPSLPTATRASDSKPVATIAAAVVVPIVVVLALVGVIAGVLIRRRRRRQPYRGGGQSCGGSAKAGGSCPKEGDLESSGGASGGPDGSGLPAASGTSSALVPTPAAIAVPAAAAAAGAAAGDGCVFWGLEEGQALPTWSVEGAAEKFKPAGSRKPRPAGAALDAADSDVGGCGADGELSMDATSDYRSGDDLDGLATVGGAGRSCQPIFDTIEPTASTAMALSRDLLPTRSHMSIDRAPATAIASAAPEPAASPGTATPVVVHRRAQHVGSGPTDGSGGAAAAGGQGGGGAAAAANSPAAVRTGSAGGGSGASTDVVSELELLARGLRSSIKDVQLRLEGVLGCGAYGTVYKGIWQGLPVAVKTLVFSASTVEGADGRRRRALQEAALCQSISHPNVIATYCAELEPLHGPLGSEAVASAAGGGSGAVAVGGGVDSGGPNGDRASSGAASGSGRMAVMDYRLYIVQEYADGGPLWRLYGNASLWPAPGEPNTPAVVSLGLGIARALAHLHSKRIIHGDLNPNNVLLKRDSSQSSGFIIKVGDFGLSVMLPEHRSHLSNLRMGTMFYMCPAVVMKAQVGPASDVFSLGVMLWELYHGRPAGTRTEQGPRYCSIFPAFPPTCPPAYSAVALHCLQRQPQNRPPATDVAERLEALLAIPT
ncbi:hypothetical protein GPECTOR_5g406 [Gonium pectorale]|uniref:Protein kinase domain-containing protein n=1 Tax=Gonium pectorale TaxID=33097 RepID=A0A150GXB1_GONPE|nr:hypothetical protein GPECTOR_5g406 [Gonium pectorale]|eukprot:KXZ54322.1 hypothetical protein GPECTOR_5g406 [Gonium pectorale]